MLINNRDLVDTSDLTVCVVELYDMSSYFNRNFVFQIWSLFSVQGSLSLMSVFLLLNICMISSTAVSSSVTEHTESRVSQTLLENPGLLGTP